MFEWLKKVVMVIGVGFVIVQSNAKAAEQCSLENARYVLKSDKHYSANFVGLKLDAGPTNLAAMALHIRSTAGDKNSAKEFWLGIEQGNGYSYAELYVIADPALHEGMAVARDGRPSENKTQALQHMPLLTASANRDISSTATLRPSDPAPQQFVIPYLGMNLWYADTHFSDQFTELNREMMPLGFFELSTCDTPLQ